MAGDLQTIVECKNVIFDIDVHNHPTPTTIPINCTVLVLYTVLEAWSCLRYTFASVFCCASANYGVTVTSMLRGYSAANHRCAVGLLTAIAAREFRRLKLILHSELRRRAALCRALPCPSSWTFLRNSVRFYACFVHFWKSGIITPKVQENITIGLVKSRFMFGLLIVVSGCGSSE